MPSRQQQRQSGAKPTRQAGSCISCQVVSCFLRLLRNQHLPLQPLASLGQMQVPRDRAMRPAQGSVGATRSRVAQMTIAQIYRLMRTRTTCGRRWTRPTTGRPPGHRSVHSGHTAGRQMRGSLQTTGTAPAGSARACLSLTDHPQTWALLGTPSWLQSWRPVRRRRTQSRLLWLLLGCAHSCTTVFCSSGW